MEPNMSARTKPLYAGARVVWYLLGALEALLVFRFLLKLFGANPNAGFSEFVYYVTYPFTEPFLNVFRQTKVLGSVFEWTTLLAMLVYWVIARAIVELFVISKPVSRQEASIKLDQLDQ